MSQNEEVDKSQLPGFVYLMDDGRDYKVGLTGDITKRLAQYKTENPRLELRDHFQCKDYKQAQEVEVELIESTKQFQTFGKEWREHTKEVLSIWKEIKHKHALMTHKQWANAFADTAELQKQYEDRLREHKKNQLESEEKRHEGFKWVWEEYTKARAKLEEAEAKDKSNQEEIKYLNELAEKVKQNSDYAHQKQIDELNRAHQKQIDELNRDHQKQIDELNRDHQKQIDELDESQREQNSTLAQRNKQTLGQHQNQLDEQKLEYENKVKVLQSSFESKISFWKSRVENVNKNLEKLSQKATGQVKFIFKEIASQISHAEPEHSQHAFDQFQYLIEPLSDLIAQRQNPRSAIKGHSSRSRESANEEIKRSILDLASKASGELKSTLDDIALNIQNGNAANQLDRLMPFIKKK